MRLVKFRHDEHTAVGALRADGTVAATPASRLEDLFAEPDPRQAVADLDLSHAAAVPVEQFLAPVVDRATVIGTGGNYADHAEEARRGGLVVTEPVFLPYLWSAITGPGQDIVIPTADTVTDYEVELAVVIGRTARRLSEADAMDAVFGWTIVNDISAREIMVRERCR